MTLNNFYIGNTGTIVYQDHAGFLVSTAWGCPSHTEHGSKLRAPKNGPINFGEDRIHWFLGARSFRVSVLCREQLSRTPGLLWKLHRSHIGVILGFTETSEGSRLGHSSVELIVYLCQTCKLAAARAFRMNRLAL